MIDPITGEIVELSRTQVEAVWDALYDAHPACHPDEPCITDQPDPDLYHDERGI